MPVQFNRATALTGLKRNAEAHAAFRQIHAQHPFYPFAFDGVWGTTLHLCDWETRRTLEPQLPAPPEELFDPDTLATELDVADIADGKLPHFYSEQRWPKSDEQLKAEEIAAQHERGRIANEKANRQEKLSDEEFRDMCLYLDPTQRHDKGCKRYR